MSSSSNSNDGIRPDLLVIRPLNEYLKLTFSQRWEVIRRHPYYQRWWRAAGQVTPSDNINLQRLRNVARLILSSAIQVESYWPDPATPFNAIASHPGLQPFHGGTLSPLIRRAHLLQTVLGLDWAAYTNIIQALIPLTPLLRRGEEGRYDLARAIRDLNIPQLDDVSNSCCFSFNPNAPLDSILSDFRDLVRRVKRDRNITETRRRPEKVNKYLEVWDAREGWESGAYRSSPIVPLREIATRLARPLKTVSDQYRSAFKIIVGHDYTSTLWLDVVASWKWSVSNNGVGGQQVRRPLRERTRQAAPFARLATTDADYLRRAGVPNEELEERELLLDIADRIRAGDDDTAIYERLELTENARRLGLVEHIRQNLSELQSS